MIGAGRFVCQASSQMRYITLLFNDIYARQGSEVISEKSVLEGALMAIYSPPSFDPLRFAARAPVKPREALIAELAYFRALNRGFVPGHDVEDWLEAEAEFERRHGPRQRP